MEITISGMLYTSLGLLLVSFPYLFYIYKSRQKEKNNAVSFQEFTLTEGLHLDKIQSWRNHYTLGLDSQQNILVYCKHGQFPVQTSVRLDAVDHVSLDSHYREVRAGNERRQKLEYLDLVLHFKDPSKPSKSIPIYDEDEVQDLADEYAIAKKWLTYLKHHLSKDQSGRPRLQWAG
uniref:hypothetical protein n=1 Tax=Algoriphagus sp. TaxID=1872435 RepID=UPI002585AC6C|nr:hypothetical protein [Algoriphagus sp.]